MEVSTARQQHTPNLMQARHQLEEVQKQVDHARKLIGSASKTTTLKTAAQGELQQVVGTIGAILAQIAGLVGSSGLTGILAGLPGVGPVLAGITAAIHLIPGLDLGVLHNILTAVLDQIETWIKEAVAALDKQINPPTPSQAPAAPAAQEAPEAGTASKKPHTPHKPHTHTKS